MSVLSSFILSSILALLGYIKKSFTKLGLILAYVLAFIICYCGGLISYIILVETFLFTIIADKLFLKKKNIKKKTEKRNYKQIICNVMIGTIALIFYKLTNSTTFFVAYAAVMSESLADSMASGIGILSDKVINLATFTSQKKGLSGGVSLLGILASILGAMIISTTFSLYTIKKINVYTLIIFICGILGALFDSFLGNFQIKYKCKVCSEIGEEEKHCKKKTQKYSGFKWLDNNIVNLLSNVFAFYLSLLLIRVLI